MQQEQRDKVYRFDQSPTAQAERLRKEARGGTPAGIKRDQLLRGALQFENEARVKRWLASQDLKPPT
ncbi:hypothetical protein CQ14_37580 [Bradyrhizobium lablabi]|uniref:Uncharacterized protein n=1 Tax=Bradyrhizobium lablabi TaxID=722472 RepID=A0A0R3MI98_9BRAD|nr:hypothetical protein [Bradyrhizobium lablabi]KRR17807.1 hypothetical protein CQ14_37580 [Bradyrhizobium lablabi]